MNISIFQLKSKIFRALGGELGGLGGKGVRDHNYLKSLVFTPLLPQDPTSTYKYPRGDSPPRGIPLLILPLDVP